MAVETKSRIAVLRERVRAAEEAKDPTYDVPFRGENKPLRKIRIKTDFPLYRIQSGRTRRAHSAYLDAHPELPSDFFADPEDRKVQEAQHQILLGMIGEMELDKDLDKKGQRAPLVLTYDGYVVDGNRRLAALREESAEYATAVVLPEDAESHEVYETELELQMQRETKAPYNWIDQALHLEYGITQLNESREVLASSMRLAVDQIDRELSKLKLVRMYLESLGSPGKYHMIPSDRGGSMEQAFEDLDQRLKSAPMIRRPESEKKMIRASCFTALQAGAGYKEIRSLIKHLGQDSGRVLARIKERAPELGTPGVPTRTGDSGRPATSAGDPLSRIVDEAPTGTAPIAEELLALVSDPGRKTKVGETILAVVEDLEDEARESKQNQVPLKLVQRAASDLEKIELDQGTDGLDQFAKALDRVFTEAERLRAAVEQIRSETT